jgi:hypothetical protein
VILFFDRNVGVKIPKAFKLLAPRGIEVKYHQQYFPQEEHGDDGWLRQVGDWGWIVIGQDHSYHDRSAELEAIRQHNVGVFYLWGAEEPKWEVMRCFARAFDNIMRCTDKHNAPYAFKVEKRGNLNEIFTI